MTKENGFDGAGHPDGCKQGQMRLIAAALLNSIIAGLFFPGSPSRHSDEKSSFDLFRRFAASGLFGKHSQ